MLWSIPIVTIAGTVVRIHVTFLLFLVWIGAPVETLEPGATLSDAVDLLLRTAQKEFPIVDGSGRPRGLLTKDALIGALREAGPASPLLDSMVREVPSLPAWRPLEAGLATLTQAKAPALFVLDDAGRLAGVITPENVGEMMLVRSVRPDFRFRRLAWPRVQG